MSPLRQPGTSIYDCDVVNVTTYFCVSVKCNWVEIKVKYTIFYFDSVTYLFQHIPVDPTLFCLVPLRPGVSVAKSTWSLFPNSADRCTSPRPKTICCPACRNCTIGSGPHMTCSSSRDKILLKKFLKKLLLKKVLFRQRERE